MCVIADFVLFGNSMLASFTKTQGINIIKYDLSVCVYATLEGKRIATFWYDVLGTVGMFFPLPDDWSDYV